MMSFLRNVADSFLGRGEAAITVPPMDGPLKPNHIIDNAEVVAELEDGTDLASDGENLWIADGQRVFRLLPDGEKELVVEFPQKVTAITWIAGRGIAVALDGCEVQIVGDKGWSTRVRSPGGKPLHAVTAISSTRDDGLVVTDASATYPTADWARDLLEKGRSGRVCRLSEDPGQDREIAGGLGYANGVCEIDGNLWVSESWEHRVLRLDSRPAHGKTATLVGRLPAYPSRISPAAGGGAWVTMFAARRRLVEFVLREDGYRKAMMAQVDPRFWVAPMLSSGNSFREPLQGGNVKTMGISKPWAPPRSYGLVVRLGPDGLPRYSLHSRSDGHHHGIVSAVEANGHLYMLSRGAGLLLRVGLDGLAERAV